MSDPHYQVESDQPTAFNLPDVDACINLMELEACENDEDFASKCRDLTTWGESCGYPEISELIQLSQRKELVSSIVTYFLMDRAHAAITQFHEGMNSLGGLFNIMKRNPQVFEPEMCGAGKKMTAEELTAMFRVNYRDDDDEDDDEHAVMKCMTKFLQDCESGKLNVTVNDVLMFITGANRIPPQGLGIINIEFFNQIPGEERLITPSTYALLLRLDRGLQVQEYFDTKVEFAVREGLAAGFGKI
ncbi:G2/M phase-specific E3 ubiquitin-protein ligase-like [Lineus longissimus]|uniref:G2/M phase-specific E3 ubiquitin-protein ligase-like n=1 Tax=Lineus longissimus TaxID=88925 RepID=UPI00315D9ABF